MYLCIMVWGLNPGVNPQWLRGEAEKAPSLSPCGHDVETLRTMFSGRFGKHEIQALVDGGEMQNDNQVNYFHPATLSNVYHSRSFYSLFVTFAAVTEVHTKVVF